MSIYVSKMGGKFEITITSIIMSSLKQIIDSKIKYLQMSREGCRDLCKHALDTSYNTGVPAYPAFIQVPRFQKYGSPVGKDVLLMERCMDMHLLTLVVEKQLYTMCGNK